jgi:type I restriction enzyme S subunit
MSVTWPTKKLGELADICRGSSPRPICDTKYFEGGTVPWVKIADATKSGKFLYKTKEHVNDYGASFSRRLPPGTILVAASGTLGYTQILGVEGCAHDGWLILQKLRGLDRDFAYYALKTLERHFFNSGSGAAIQNINTDILREAEIPYPPLPVQRRIAGILSAYDELIENSQRRIRLLEDMACALYREWFVHFRFPGHESVSRLPSALGDIPQGWEVLEFRHLFNIRYGKTLPKTEISDSGPFPVYGAGNVIGFYDKMLCPNKCALVTSRGNGSGTVWRTREAAFVTNNSLMMLPKEDRNHWDYSFVELLLKHANVMEAKTGSAQPQVTIENLNYVKAIVPTKRLAERFCVLATPIYEQVDLLFSQIQNLRCTRDLLLPRLLSGDFASRSP